MAKSLLLNILVDILGNYVEDLTKDNLKLAVWSGTIELYNLKLKSSALDKLNLPVKVLRGSLKKLQLKIPWTNLESKPVSVIMDGMFLETGPVDLSEISTADAKRMVAKSRQKKMEKAERAIMAIIHNKSYKRKKKASYMKNLTAKIMDNLEISITNLHIRYEDQDSIPGTIISCGITIESISLQTTDENWNPAYFTRDGGDKTTSESDLTAQQKKKLTAIHKLGTLKNFAIYWNSAHSAYTKSLLKKARIAASLAAAAAVPPPPVLSSLPSSVPVLGGFLQSDSMSVGSCATAEDEQARLKWENKMQSLIYTDAKEAADVSAAEAGIHLNISNEDHERESLETMKYLLRPPNKVTIKTIHRELCTETLPNMDITITCTTIQSKLVDDQYRQLRTLSKVLKGLDRRKLMLYHRPGVRATADPKAWWHYAYFLATGNYPIRRGKMEVMTDCILAKKHLVPFWRRNLVNKEVVADQEFIVSSSFLDRELSAEVKALDLEEKVPITALIALRQYAAQEAVIEIKRLRSNYTEMKKYIEEHHLDPEREAELGKGKFWGLGKLAKAKKGSDFDDTDFIPGKKKKGIFKMLFKKHKSKKQNEVDSSQHSTPTLSTFATGGMGVGSSVASTTGGTIPADTASVLTDGIATIQTNGNRYRTHTEGEETDNEHEYSEDEKGLFPLEDGLLDGELELDKLLLENNNKELSEDLLLEGRVGIGGEVEVDGENIDNDLEDADDEKLMEELQAALIKSSLDADQAFTLRVKLVTNITLKINLNKQTIVIITMAIRICNEKRRNLQRFLVEIDNISIKDMISIKPLFKYIITTTEKNNILNQQKLKRNSINKQINNTNIMKIPPIEFTKSDQIEPRSENNPVLINLLFEKKKGDSIEKGNSNLVLHTSPMCIIWNEYCIRQLLLCFTLKSNTSDIDLYVQSAIERNKLLSQGIKKFKAELSAPSYKTTTITTELHSLCVIIPEQYDVDVGCVQLNIGKVLVQGRKGYAGMSLKIQLLAVNLSLPVKIADIANTTGTNNSTTNNILQQQQQRTERSLTNEFTAEHIHNNKTTTANNSNSTESYLIKPFDVNISMDKFSHNIIADTCLNIAILPRIDARFDSLNLIRLNYILKNMISSLKKPKDNTVVDTKKASKKAEKLKKKKKAEQLHEEGEIEINYLRQQMYCQFSLPSAHINIELSSEHTVDFNVHGISLRFISRIGDSRCVLGLEALSLHDSLRPKAHRAIIWTADNSTTTEHNQPVRTNPDSSPRTVHRTVAMGPSDLKALFGTADEDSGQDSDEEDAKRDPSDHSIVFAYTAISTIQSPLFTGLSKDINISWCEIYSNIDDKSIQRFGPFMSDLTNNIKIYKEKSDEHDRAVTEFTELMNAAAIEYQLQQQQSRSSRKGSTLPNGGGFMSPGGTIVPGSVSVRQRPSMRLGSPGLTRPVSSSSSSNANTIPKKEAKIGPTRLTFHARSFTVDVLQELLTPEQQAATVPDTIDSNVAFAENNARTSLLLQKESLHSTSFHSIRRRDSYASRDSFFIHSQSDGDYPHSLDSDTSSEYLPHETESDNEEEEEEEEEERLESAFRVEFGELYFQMVAKEEEKEVTALMKTFLLKDIRSTSNKFVFNTLVSRSDKLQKLQTEAVSNVLKIQKNDDTEYILTVKFIKKSKQFIDTEVIFQDITSYIAIDIFLSFATLMNDNIKAIKVVKKIIKMKKKKAEPSLKTKLAMEAYIKSKNKRNNSTNEAPPINEKKVIRNLSITIINPRLFLLENPENYATKAIVSDCKLNFFIVRETYTYTYVDYERVEVKDSIHLSLREFQLFVWTNIQEQSMPHLIIEPAGIDIHILNSTENDVCILKQFKCSTDNFRGRVSLNDIVLTTSILARAKLIQKSKKNKVKKVKKPKKKKGNTVSNNTTALTEEASIFITLTMYKLDLNIGKISLVLLNDFNNQNVPLFKACLDQSDFNAEGSKQHMEGSGSILLAVDNYNLQATCWEPIIEPWQPTLIFSKDFHGTRFTLLSENTLQLNISGIFCNSLYRSQALVTKIGKEGAYGTQRTIFPLIVRNLLGVSIELYDSRSKESVLKLDDDQIHAVPSKTQVSTLPVAASSTSEQVRSETYADLFDIHLLGPEANCRLPILQAPLTAGRPKRYLFRYHERQAFHYEPIEEEVYENQRFNPLRQTWVDPWMPLIDYPKWSDSRGNAVVGPDEYIMPLNWRWADPDWLTDVGEVGVETDAQGWQYESNFVQFSANRHQRRAQTPLDVVRRRRLVRSRTPRLPQQTSAVSPPASAAALVAAVDSVSPRSYRSRSDSSGTSLRRGSSRRGNSSSFSVEEPPSLPQPMAVYWEVITKGDESREIIISSGFHINNESPCALEIEFLNAITVEGESNELPFYAGRRRSSSAYISQSPSLQSILLVEENSKLGVPLSLANSDFLRIRPVATRHVAYEWSENINCKFRAAQHNDKMVFRVRCERVDKPNNVYFFTVQAEIKDKQLIITCSCNVTLFNGLPCAIKLRCSNTGSAVNAAIPVVQSEDTSPIEASSDISPQPAALSLESTLMLPGTTIKVPRLSLQHDVDISLEIAGHHSIKPLRLTGFSKFEAKEFVVWLENLNNTSVDEGDSEDPDSSTEPSTATTITTKSEAPEQQHSSRSSGSSGIHRETNQFSVIVRCEMSVTDVLCIYIYTQYLLIDQSASDLVLRSFYSDAQSLEMVNRLPSNLKRQTLNKEAPRSDHPAAEGERKVHRVVDRCTYALNCSQGVSIADQVLQQQAERDLSDCWATGGAGMTMFQAGSGQLVSIGVNRGSGWYHDIPLMSLSSSKTPIEIRDEATQNCYNLGLTMTSLKNPMVTTNVIRVLPCYTIVNCLEEGIEILHPSDDFLDTESETRFLVPSNCTRPWHRLAKYTDAVVRLRCDKSTASIGTIDLNEIGSTMLILPRFQHDDNFRGEDLIIAHVEVKFSETSASSCITIVIWRSLMKFGIDMEVQRTNCAYLSVRNETDFPFTIQQDGAIELFNQTEDPERLHKFDLNIMPGQWLPYGWTDPRLGKKLLASMGIIAHGTQTVGGRRGRGRRNSINSFSSNPSCVVDVSKVNAVSVMDLSAFQDADMVNISFALKTLGNGLVLCIYKSNELLGTGAKMYFKNTENETDDPTKLSPTKEVDDRRKALSVKIQLQSISLSLIAEQPKRRELLGMFIDRFETTFRKNPESLKDGAMSSIEVKVRDVQLDNYSESTVYPVLTTSMYSDERAAATRRWRLHNESLRSSTTTITGRRSSFRASPSLPIGSYSGELQPHTQQQSILQVSRANNCETEEYPCFLQFSAARESPKGRGKVDAIIKYVGLRVLEVKVAVDSSSLVMFYLDLQKDLSGSGITVDDSELAVRMYYEEFTQQATTYLLKHSGLNALDPAYTFKKAQVRKYYFETVVLHPLKFTLTFTTTSLSRFQKDNLFRQNKKLKLLQSGNGIPDIENFEIKLTSFIVNQAMESIKTMKARIIKKIKNEIKANLLLIGGNLLTSMNIIGKPAGLLKNIGTGVQAFVYEPYLGSLEGPSAFAAGIGKGTGALFTGVATGLVGYTASLVNTASSGVSLVARGVVAISSGGGDDDKFLQSRETKKRLFKASDGGVLKGFQQGGMDVLAGIGSGFKGLVTKPMNEGKKSGALGVMRGIGMGLVGAVVKPVLGISDGISTVTAGVTKEMLVDSSHQAKHARPSRALERANPLSDKVLVLLPMDVFAAKAQDFLRQITGQQDEYLASCALGYEVTADEFPDAEYGLLLSTSHIYLLSTSIQVIWTISFSELSHIVLKKNTNPNLTEADHSQFGMLGFLLYGCSLMVQKTLTCPNRVHALRVYGFMCKFAYRMGNPSAVVPLEEHLADVTRPVAHSSATASASQRKRSVSEHRGFRLDQYIFGFANNMQLSITLSMNFMTEEHIITQARERFRLIYCMNMSDEEAVYFYYRLLDEALFTLAMDWKNFHTLKLTPSHCCVCLLLNSSPSYAPVQILDIDMIEGRDYHIFSVGGAYDTASQSIAPGGGGVVLFAYGHPPTLNDTPTVKIFVKSTAFSVILSSRAGEPNCTTHNGFTVSYLEKARSNYWSKSVINISLHK